MRKDRVDITQGGVCVYIRDNINFTILEDLEDPSFEALWLKLRPARLPRGFSCIVLRIIYHPLNNNNPEDFNRLNTKRLQNIFGLKQIVKFPTRGDKILDLVLTNLREYYKDPIQRPPHGLSDQMSVEVQPKDRSQLPDSRSTIKTASLYAPTSKRSMRTPSSTTYMAVQRKCQFLVNNPTWSGQCTAPAI